MCLAKNTNTHGLQDMAYHKQYMVLVMRNEHLKLLRYIIRSNYKSKVKAANNPHTTCGYTA